jgi:HEAT repeat protein
VAAVTILLLLGIDTAGIQVVSEAGAFCPIVGLPGLFGPDGSSLFRRWLRRYVRRDGREDNPGKNNPLPRGPGIDELSGAPQGFHAHHHDGMDVIGRMENIPGALRRFDDLVSPGGAADPEENSTAILQFDDSPLPGRTGTPLEVSGWHDSETDPDGCLPDEPDIPLEHPPDDEPAPQPEPLTDEELMRLLGLDDGGDEPSAWGADFGTFPLAGDPDPDEPVVVPDPDEPADSIVVPDNNRPLELLIGDLGSPDAEVRRCAVRAVAECGADAVSPLIRALARADDRSRWCIAEALALIGEDAIPALIAALGNDAVQAGAAATLVRMGEPAVPPLITALARGDDEVRFGALYALREIGDATVPFLVEVLDAPDGEIRRSAASVLREIGWKPVDDDAAIRYFIAGEAWLDAAEYGGRAVDPLIRILRSPDRDAWWNAARTLGEIGAPAVDPLIGLLYEADDEDLRPLAGMALAEIGLPAVNSLIGLLSEPVLRETAVAALLKIGEAAAEACVLALDGADTDVEETLRGILGALGEAAIPPLIQALTAGRSGLRGGVADILDGMGWEPWSDNERAWYLIAREEWMELALMGEPAVDPLIRALRGDDDRIRSEAAATLGELGLPAAVGPLVDALASDAVAPAAADALVAIGKPAVLPVLVLLERETGAVRETAVEVLGRLGAPEAVPAIVGLVRNGGDRLHRKAVDALVGIGEPAVNALIPLLGEDGDGHAGATAALTGIGDVSVPPLLEALEDENARIRMGAALVLKRLGRVPVGVEEQAAHLIALQQWPDAAGLGATAVAPLAARLADPDPAVQAGVADALARIGAPAAPPLICLLGDGARRRAAGDTLVRIGEAAVEPLIGVLEDEELRGAVAEVLVRIGRPAAGALVPALGDSGRGQAAAEVLGAMGESSLDLLVEALGDDDALVRQRAGDLLLTLGETAIGPLVGALGHPTAAVRQGAIDTLARSGKPAVAALTEALEDERYFVRLGAAEVLGRTGWVPETEGETIRYLIAKEQWASVAEIGPGAVEPLIRTLSDPDSAIQMGAARALGMMGAPAVTRLVRELAVEQDGRQRKVVEALKMIGEPAVMPLIDSLQDREWHVRLGAVRTLVGIGDAAVEQLVLALRSGPPAVRMGAAATLGKIGGPAAIGPLTDALLYDEQRVGRVAVRALGMTGEAAVNPLLRVLREGNDDARRGAVAALVLIGAPAAGLLPGALADEDFRVRAGAADALDRLGWSPEPGEETVRYLIAKERWSDLARMGSPVVGPLVAALNDPDDSIRRRVARVLGEVRDPRAIPALMALLHDDYYSIRREAAAALAAAGALAVEPVISALDDPDGDVRKRAADVLAGIGDARAIEPLLRIRSDEDWYVRRAAEDAVKRIRERSEGSR